MPNSDIDLDVTKPLPEPIYELLLHSPHSNLTKSFKVMLVYNKFENVTSKITHTFPSDWWVDYAMSETLQSHHGCQVTVPNATKNTGSPNYESELTSQYDSQIIIYDCSDPVML